VWIDKTAQGGNPAALELPRALPQKATYDFSFSGLKTAAAQQMNTVLPGCIVEMKLNVN